MLPLCNKKHAPNEHALGQPTLIPCLLDAFPPGRISTMYTFPRSSSSRTSPIGLTNTNAHTQKKTRKKLEPRVCPQVHPCAFEYARSADETHAVSLVLARSSHKVGFNTYYRKMRPSYMPRLRLTRLMNLDVGQSKNLSASCFILSGNIWQ